MPDKGDKCRLCRIFGDFAMFARLARSLPFSAFAQCGTALRVVNLRRGGSYHIGRLAAIILVFVFALASSGCTSIRDYVNNGFKVGSNYRKPPAPVANEWIDSKSRGVNVAAKDLRDWWFVF